MSDRTLEILGALSEDLDAPLLARRVGTDRLIVLAPSVPSQVLAALGALADPRIVAPFDEINVEGRPFALVEHVGFLDLYQLDTGARLLPGQALYLICRAATLLARAHEAGVAHGGLSPASLRLLPDGDLCIVGARGGSLASDVRALREIAERLLRVHELGELPPRLQGLLQEWPAEMPAVVEHLSDHAATALDLEGLRAPDPALYAHPLQGQQLKLEPAGPAPVPPKVRVAGIGAITLLLGLAGGFYLGWSPVGPLEVSVIGLSDVEITCEPIRASDSVLKLQAPARCRVTGERPSGEAFTGELDIMMSGRYVCRTTEGALRCDER